MERNELVHLQKMAFLQSAVMSQVDTLSTTLRMSKDELGKKLVGFSSDGASVMIGVHSGVVIRLKNSIAPRLHNIHCLAHCTQVCFHVPVQVCHFVHRQFTYDCVILQLASAEIGKVELFKEVIDLLRAVANYVADSGKRQANLSVWEEISGSDIIKLEQLCLVRFVIL